MTGFALEQYLLFDLSVLCMDLLFETIFYLICCLYHPYISSFGSHRYAWLVLEEELRGKAVESTNPSRAL